MSKHSVLSQGGRALVLLALAVLLAGCADLPINTQTAATTPASVLALQRLNVNDRPRIAVQEFRNKANASSYAEIGTGMADQLVTALSQSDAFIVIERNQLRPVSSEQELSNLDRFNPETAALAGRLEGVDFLIVGAITEYEPNQTNMDASLPVVVPGEFGPLLVGVARGMFNQAHVAIDMRVIDVRTARIVKAVAVEGSPREVGGGANAFLAGFIGSVKTPMEKAVRACIIKAVGEIANAIAPGWVGAATGTVQRRQR